MKVILSSSCQADLLFFILGIILRIFCILHVNGADDEETMLPFTFSHYYANDFFYDNDKIEASGVAIAADSSHLVIVGDEKRIVFVNLLDDENHCVIKDLDEVMDYGSDFEGVTIDTNAWSQDDKHIYVIHEGGLGERYEIPYLYKIRYEYDPDKEDSCSIEVVESISLNSALPCLTTDNGIESLTLKSPSTTTTPATFYVGIQDSGNLYEITSKGVPNSPNCYDGGMAASDISASTYSIQHDHIWSRVESEESIAVINPTKDCTVGIYELLSEYDEEGLVIDFANGYMYLVTDGQGDGSTLAVFDFVYPTDIEDCMVGEEGDDENVQQFSASDSLEEGRSCDRFTVCDGTPFPPTPSPVVAEDNTIAIVPTIETTNVDKMSVEEESDGNATKQSNTILWAGLGFAITCSVLFIIIIFTIHLKRIPPPPPPLASIEDNFNENRNPTKGLQHTIVSTIEDQQRMEIKRLQQEIQKKDKQIQILKTREEEESVLSPSDWPSIYTPTRGDAFRDNTNRTTPIDQGMEMDASTMTKPWDESSEV